MDTTKFHRLRSDCHQAIRNGNLGKCFELLAKQLDGASEAYRNYLLLAGDYERLTQNQIKGLLNFSEQGMELSKISNRLLAFIDSEIKPIEVSLLSRTQEQILIVACKNSPTDWKGLFPAAFFAQVAIIFYGDEVPKTFKSPDVVIFDDLNCDSNRDEIRLLSEAMPDANLLYFGEKNIFKEGTDEEKLIFDRMSNTNSRFSIHARLRELLEYRNIYEKTYEDKVG